MRDATTGFVASRISNRWVTGVVEAAFSSATESVPPASPKSLAI
jgi:hypothetical protein